MLDIVGLFRELEKLFKPPRPFRHAISYANLTRGTLTLSVWLNENKCKTIYIAPELQARGVDAVIEHVKKDTYNEQ